MKKSEQAAAIAEVTQKLKDMAEGSYKATAIKVELEAQLDRPGDDREQCEDCEGQGDYYCESCVEGYITDEETEESHLCPECDGSERITCGTCEGSGSWSSDGDWCDESCGDFILDNVSHEARDALIYSQFYDDGSVDSEFTFTLPIDQALLAIEFIRAFKKLAEEIGNGLEVGGAGMHIAVLNDPKGAYGTYGAENTLDDVCTDNFVQAVTPLLPALYFLGSSDHRSRQLSYRRPWISSPWHHHSEKYSAINGGQNVFEFRVFETCYDRPEALIDYLIVIANCLQFYKSEKTDNSLHLELGFKGGNGLSRFYYSENHIKALERGLRLLKPAYKTITALKAERQFKYSLTDPKAFKKQQEKQWCAEYQTAKERIRFERSRRYHNAIADYYGSMETDGQAYVLESFGKTPREYALKVLKHQYGHLYGGSKAYVQSRKNELDNTGIEYRIAV